MKIRIKTAKNIIEKDAEIIDKIDSEGNQYSIALSSGRVYKVIDRDFYGAIYGNEAAALGKLGGKSTSEAKKSASRENGKKGGRPKKKPETKEAL